MKTFIFSGMALLSLLSTSAFAAWDYQAAFSARSQPVGAIFSGNLGYGLLLWGQDPIPNAPPIGFGDGPVIWKYGYIRPSITAQTIGVTNRAFAELEAAPIAPLSFVVGHGYHGKTNSSAQFDCALTACGSLLTRTYARARLVVGAAGVFGIATFRQDWMSHTTTDKPFVEETSTLLGSPGSDQLQTGAFTLGYTINSKWMVGVNYALQRFANSGNNNSNVFGWANLTHNQWGFLLGAGSYVSTHQGLSPTVILQIQLIGARALGLI